MGIRGLTSYITRNADHFHQTLHLHDCVLVIDGCSLACQLFMHASKCNIAFGGDYDEYAQTLMDFFSLLKKCNVTPLVIVDGGYEARKLKTISKRMRRKLYNAKICNPVNMSRAPVFPLLLMEVFKQTLKRIGVQFAQADFEADYEIAAAARYLNCPVLSNDSDFYVFDVDYIPFSTLKRNLVKMIKDGSTKYYLNCEMYSVKYLLARFGGLDKSLLPLMATLLGNDYVPSSIFKKFFDQVKLPKSKKMSLQQRRIVATFEWLRKESLETASSKILNHLRKEHRKYVQKQIEMSVSGYNICQSDLIALFDLQGMHPQVEVPEKDGELLYGESDFPEDTLDEVESDNEDEDSCNEFDSLDPTFEFEANTPGSDVHFPVWLTDKFRRGDLPSYVSDIYHLRLYFCQPQVEDFSTEDSHCTSFQILKVICGLLLSISDKQTLNSVDNSIMCYSRCSGSKHMKCELYLTHSLPCLPQFPPVALLLQLPISLRKLLLYNTLNITNSEEITLLDSFGMIALGVVDKKLGRIRHQKEITQRTNNALRKGSTNLDSYKEATNAYPLELFSENIRNTLDNTVLKVSENDCLNVIESLLQFYHMDPKLKHSPGLFYASIVHSFAQFQACLMQVMCLNAILDFPVTQCNVADVYSGTVAYMGFSNFHKRRNVPSYIHTLMVNSPTLYDLYKEIFDRFQILLPNVPVLFRKGKRKSKCKRLKPADTPTDSNSEGWESKQESVSGFDVQNKFWALSVL